MNAGGEYVYTGKYLKFQGEKSRKRSLMELWGLTVPMAVCVIAGGCIPAPGTQNTFYVLLPMMVEIILAVSCLWLLGQVTLGGDPMKEYVYHDSAEKLPGRLLATAVFAAATALLELLYLGLNGGFGLLAGLVLGMQIMVIFLAFWGRKFAARMKWEQTA